MHYECPLNVRAHIARRDGSSVFFSLLIVKIFDLHSRTAQSLFLGLSLLYSCHARLFFRYAFIPSFSAIFFKGNELEYQEKLKRNKKKKKKENGRGTTNKQFRSPSCQGIEVEGAFHKTFTRNSAKPWTQHADLPGFYPLKYTSIVLPNIPEIHLVTTIIGLQIDWTRSETYPDPKRHVLT